MTWNILWNACLDGALEQSLKRWCFFCSLDRTLMAGRRAVGKRWGLAPRQTKWLYESVVRPMVTY